jgi:hypothetical protein
MRARLLLHVWAPFALNCRRGLRLGRVPKLVAAGYAVLGLGASANQGYEVFPFFSWFLFPLTPNYVTRYELTPLPALSALGRLHQMDMHVLLQEFGAALDGRDPLTSATLRGRLEGNFFVLPCQYAIARTEYEPIARWITGEAKMSRTVAEFTCQTP